MKKQLIGAGLMLFVLVSKAQQPPGPPTVEERLKRTNEVIQKEVQPTAAQKTAIESTFKNFFAAADKLRKDNPPPPPPPPDPKVKEAMDKLVKERDDKIKQVLTADQYKKYTEAEKKLHPPKPGDERGKDGPPKPPQP
jgi:membrane-bound lytic murein transglycosylase B